MAYETILYQEDGPIGTITLNRPDDGNMFTPLMCHEMRDCINDIRRETRTRSDSVRIVIPGSTRREQAGTSTRDPVTSTTHTRQTLTGVKVGR